jgi:hypothetical protein
LQGASDRAAAVALYAGDVDTAVRLAQQSYAAGDTATGRVLVAAARSMLGAIDERFQLPGGERARALLRDADSDLKAIELADSVTATAFEPWHNRWPARAETLRSAEASSYFSEALVRRALRN